MIIGCIADDFTGASDIASILTENGMRTRLCTDLDALRENEEAADAVVIALKTRSVAPDDAVRHSLAALDVLRAQGCRQFYFKYCSTFDSTPQGNIGPVAEALADALEASKVIFCPSFPANGRTLYQGHLFVGDVLVSDSSMRDHPVTPMVESDLRSWLARQSTGPVGHVPHAIVREGRQAIASAIAAVTERLVLVDGISDADLVEIGRAAGDMILITGGSALAMALPEHHRQNGSLRAVPDEMGPHPGPAIILAGSCSTATNAQVSRYRANHPSFEINSQTLAAGYPVLDYADAFAREHTDAAPMIYSTITPTEVSARRGDKAFATASAAIELLMADLAVRAVARGVRRIVVAGGETSGSVVAALKPGVLKVGPQVAPGVPLLVNDGICYALKSGNFGGDDFFETALGLMEGGA